MLFSLYLFFNLYLTKPISLLLILHFLSLIILFLHTNLNFFSLNLYFYYQLFHNSFTIIINFESTPILISYYFYQLLYQHLSHLCKILAILKVLKSLFKVQQFYNFLNLDISHRVSQNQSMNNLPNFIENIIQLKAI